MFSVLFPAPAPIIGLTSAASSRITGTSVMRVNRKLILSDLYVVLSIHKDVGDFLPSQSPSPGKIVD